jgi:hypothetical protein
MNTTKSVKNRFGILVFIFLLTNSALVGVSERGSPTRKKIPF